MINLSLHVTHTHAWSVNSETKCLDTTRLPRSGEEDGKDYFFVTPESFEDLAAAGGFLEHAQFGGNSYGTSTAAVEAVRKDGKTCLLDIEMEVRLHLFSLSLFLLPSFSPSSLFLSNLSPSPCYLYKPPVQLPTSVELPNSATIDIIFAGRKTNKGIACAETEIHFHCASVTRGARKKDT